MGARQGKTVEGGGSNNRDVSTSSAFYCLTIFLLRLSDLQLHWSLW